MEKYQAIKFDELTQLEEEEKLFLPNFQREFVWTTEEQEKLLASFLVDIPIGSLLLVEGKGDEFSTRKLCYENSLPAPGKECLYLLDGQQRISTLKNIFTNFYEDLTDWSNPLSDGELYKRLKLRWYLKIKPENYEEDYFGYDELNFDPSKINNATPNDLVSFVESKDIYKTTKLDKWFSPGFYEEVLSHIPKDQKNKINHEIAKLAGKEYLVPLYTLESKQSKPLHEHVLEEISQQRISELKNEINDGKRKLSKVFPNEDKIEAYENNPEKYSEEITVLWIKKQQRWIKDIDQYLRSLLKREIARIKLGKDEINRAISVFEEMNRQGTRLSVFDLIVARAAIENPKSHSLRIRIINYLNNSLSLPDSLDDGIKNWRPEQFGLLGGSNPPVNKFRNLFLNLMSLQCFLDGDYEKIEDIKPDHIKEKEQLKLTSEEINSYYKKTCIALCRAFAFLQQNCGVISISDIQYQLMVLPIAIILMKDKFWKDSASVKKLEYWYWCSIFSGVYREGQNARSVDDIKKVVSWIVFDNENPFKERENNIFKEEGYSDLETLLLQNEEHSPPKAVAKGILQFILRSKPYDLISGDMLEGENSIKLTANNFASEKEIKYKSAPNSNLKPQTHHIIPFGSITKLGEKAQEKRDNDDFILNSPLNTTIISADTNRMISDMNPDKYLAYLEEIQSMGHHINLDKIKKLREPKLSLDDFEDILKDRFKEIKKAVVIHVDSLIN